MIQIIFGFVNSMEWAITLHLIYQKGYNVAKILPFGPVKNLVRLSD